MFYNKLWFNYYHKIQGLRAAPCKYQLVYLNGNNAAEGENNVKYASSYPMN